MPRQMPRYGISRSRATRQARIFPSQPREPKPPGHEHPVDLLEQRRSPLRATSLPHRPSSRARFAPWCAPACFSASCTDRYASCSFTYLPTSAISTSSVALLHPLGQVEPVAEIGSAGGEPELLADQPVEPFRLQPRRDEIDVRHVAGSDHGLGLDVGEQRDLLADVDATALRASGRRRCPGGYRCAAAR